MNDSFDDMDDIPEQLETQNEVGLIKASEPETEPEQSSNSQMTNNGKVKPKTVEIQNKTRILPYVTSQSPRKKHFMFSNDADRERLSDILKKTGLTVEYSTVRDKPYISLMKENELVGKIHLLYYNENTPDDKYIKLYLFDFVDPDQYSIVKSKLVNFFENFTPSKNLKGGNKRKSNTKHHRTYKKRRNIRRKKTLRRK
jgi:hypothetical protein